MLNVNVTHKTITSDQSPSGLLLVLLSILQFYLMLPNILIVMQDETRLREALVFANACGAITVTKKGAIPAMPTRDEVHKILKHES